MGVFSLLMPQKFVATGNYLGHVHPSRVNTGGALHQGRASRQLHRHDHIVLPPDPFGTLHDNLR